MKPHIGIYAIIENDEKILLIRKSRGPYEGLLDLPGGRPFFGESLEKALIREVREETGAVVQDFSLFGNYAFFMEDQQFYHIALVYRAQKVDFSKLDTTIDFEDARGCLWVEKKAIGTPSPLVEALFKKSAAS